MIEGYEKEYGEYGKLFRAQDGKFFRVEVWHDLDPLNPLEDCDGNGKIHSFSTNHYNFLDLSREIESLSSEYEEESLEALKDVWEGLNDAVTDMLEDSDTSAEQRIADMDHAEHEDVMFLLRLLTGEFTDADKEELTDRIKKTKALEQSTGSSYWAKLALDEMFGPQGIGWLPLSYYKHGLSMWFPQGTYIPGVEYQWDGVRFAGVWEMDKLVQENLGDPKEEGYAERAYKYCSSVCEEYTDWCNGNVFGYTVTVLDRKGKEIDEDCCGGFYSSSEEYMHDEIQSTMAYYGAERVTEVENEEIFAAEVPA